MIAHACECCDGKGKIKRKVCPVCNGTGKVVGHSWEAIKSCPPPSIINLSSCDYEHFIFEDSDDPT